MPQTKRRPAFVLVCLVFVGAAAFWGCAKQVRHPGERVYLHKVEAAETLADIAEEYYGDPERAPEIGDFNAVAGDTVSPGSVLRVPMTAKDIDRLEMREQARVPYNRGLEFVENASYIDAVQQFEEALSIDPDFVDAIYNLGVTLETLKSYRKAIGHLERAAELRSGNVKYRFAVGNCLFHLGDFSGAMRSFEWVMQNDPANEKALYSLAVCYEKQGEREKAIRAWERYLELDGTSAWAAEARKRLEELR